MMVLTSDEKRYIQRALSALPLFAVGPPRNLSQINQHVFNGLPTTVSTQSQLDVLRFVFFLKGVPCFLNNDDKSKNILVERVVLGKSYYNQKEESIIYCAIMALWRLQRKPWVEEEKASLEIDLFCDFVDFFHDLTHLYFARTPFNAPKNRKKGKSLLQLAGNQALFQSLEDFWR